MSEPTGELKFAERLFDQLNEIQRTGQTADALAAIMEAFSTLTAQLQQVQAERDEARETLGIVRGLYAAASTAAHDARQAQEEAEAARDALTEQIKKAEAERDDALAQLNDYKLGI